MERREIDQKSVLNDSVTRWIMWLCGSLFGSLIRIRSLAPLMAGWLLLNRVESETITTSAAATSYLLSLGRVAKNALTNLPVILARRSHGL